MGGKNSIVGVFVMASARDLMYDRYLSRLCADQLLYTDMDSVVVFHNETNKSHVTLPTSDLLGDLKDEYGDFLASNPSWYMGEFIAFGPKMYQLIFKDKVSGRIMKWMKMMKGISMKGNIDMFSGDKLPIYRNPVMIFAPYYSMVHQTNF